MININDSMLFLGSCRNALYTMHDNKDLKYFIQNEASDYQIMSIIVNDEIPEEKYNTEEEYKLWDQFQQLVYEYSNDKKLHKLFGEMGPIFEYNLSTTRPALQLQEADQPRFVQGLFDKMSSLRKSAKSGVEKATKATVDTAKKGGINSIAVGMTAGAVAGIIAFTANKLYQNFLSKAARECKGKPDKSACMKQYKNKALRLRMDKLKSGMGTCSKAKNAENCKKSLQSKISAIQLRMTKQRP